MTSLAQALADPDVRLDYLLFCFAVMILPMVALKVWHSFAIGKSGGGRALMRRQAANPAHSRGSAGQVVGGLAEAASMVRDVSSGRYGDHARRVQNKVYLLTGLWALANVIAFGILLWADEVNRAVPAPLINP